MIECYARNGDEITYEQWGELHANHEYRRVALDTIGPYRVSTIWLGLNHGGPYGPPLIFETMVFSVNEWDEPGFHGLHDFDRHRYSTEQEAVAGHEATCLLIRATLVDPSEVHEWAKE